MGIINPFHNHDPENDTMEILEWIDAGIFSGDLLYCVDTIELKRKFERFLRAIKDHEETLRKESEEMLRRTHYQQEG